jgi:3-phosphoshikimate 1-carboxyvinyltransferase
MGRVITPLEPMGARFAARAGGRLPLTVIGTGQGQPTRYHLPVASAQVKSAILLAALNTEGTTTIIEDHPTRDHSENMLRYFGANVQCEAQKDGSNHIHIEGRPTLKPGMINVPSDPSSAAFPVVAALLNEGSDITCRQIGMSPTRDGLYQTLQEMGADLTLENQRNEGGEIIADLRVRASELLKGITVPPQRVPSMIDEFPILAMAAACAEGSTIMTGLAELRVKESDRLLVVAEGLKACGVDLEMGEDSLTIHGTGTPPQGGATINAHLDHRIAMSFLILGTVTQRPIIIDDASPIRTSFPDFVELMSALGADIAPTEG